MKLLAGGHKKESKVPPEFDFSVHKYFPVVKLVWKRLQRWPYLLLGIHQSARYGDIKWISWMTNSFLQGRLFSLTPLLARMKTAVLKWFIILHGCNWAGMHWWTLHGFITDKNCKHFFNEWLSEIVFVKVNKFLDKKKKKNHWCCSRASLLRTSESATESRHCQGYPSICSSFVSLYSQLLGSRVRLQLPSARYCVWGQTLLHEIVS